MDELRKIAHESAWIRRQTIDTDYYSTPPSGMFVGEHTGFVVADPALILALLDVAEAARPEVDSVPKAFHDETIERLSAALDHLEGLLNG